MKIAWKIVKHKNIRLKDKVLVLAYKHLWDALPKTGH